MSQPYTPDTRVANQTKGHFPGCDTVGCAATRCHDARYQRRFAEALPDKRVADLSDYLEPVVRPTLQMLPEPDWFVWCAAYDAAVAADKRTGRPMRIRHYWLVADAARAAYLKE